MAEQLSCDKIRQMMVEIFGERMPFHQLIGLRVEEFEADSIELRIRMKPELVGNMVHQILHGGVTAAILDVAGGMIAFAAVLESMEDTSMIAVQKRMKNLGTIDLRVDYLRPGRGEEFIATAQVIRAGNKVSVSRMELHNEKGDHIAFGTGTYMVG